MKIALVVAAAVASLAAQNAPDAARLLTRRYVEGSRLQYVARHPSPECRCGLLRRPAKHDDVLSWQLRNCSIEGESLGLDLGADFNEAHLVIGQNLKAGVLLAVFQQNQLSVRFERPADAPEHLLRVPELVVDIDE